MADNTVNLTLKLKSDGMEGVEKGSKRIRDNLEGAQAAAQGIGAPGSASSRKMASSAAARPTGAAGVSAGVEGGDVEMYNRARGASGAAGGSARDFADQARGLGGLVRLYATFAANIFAVSAAFNALSRAMDTTNMVKGLDQLGAASGRNLGSLSKQLALASDGAVSLREAMEATAKASSAGLSNKQILELGEGAKKAAQALGLNMTDALSRLSRGISKIEPELLDELGIYVKIDEATQTYARSIGKAAGSLSEFERRQAFANAALDQLKQKFGDIQIDVNPYTKLSASLQNLLQTGLELVNKVLAPLVKYLSESPVALATVVGAIGLTLLKQVLPVLGQLRESLKKSAQEAALSAEKIQNSFGDQFQSKLEAKFSLPKLQEQLDKTKKQIDNLSSKPIQAPLVVPKSLEGMKSLAEEKLAGEAGVRNLQDLISKRQQYVDTAMRGQKKLSAEQVQNYKEELTYLRAKEAALQRELQLGALRGQQLKQQTALLAAQEAAQKLADQPLGRFDPERLNADRVAAARARTTRAELVSGAAESASILGIRNSWSLLNKEIAEKGVTGLNKYLTLAQGGLAAVGTRLLGFIGVLGTAGAALAAVLGIWELVSAVASKNSKEAKETSEGFERLNESARFVDSVLADISRKDPLASISVESINARANAFNNLAESLQDQVKKIVRQAETANWFDIFVDTVKADVGLGLLNQSAKELSYSVSQAFKVMAEGPAKTDAIEKFKRAFKIDPTDQEAFEKVLKESPEKFLSLAPAVADLMQEINREVGNTASKGKDLIAALDAASKTLKDFVVSSLPSDPVSKFGGQLVDIGVKLNAALKDPQTRLAAIAEILKSPDKLSLLGQAGVELAELGPQAQQNLATLTALNNTLERLTARQKELTELSNKRVGRTVRGLAADERKELAEIKTAIPAIQEAKKGLQALPDQLGTKLEQAATEALVKGTNYLKAGVDVSFAKAAITVSTALAERLGDTEAGIRRRAELQVQANSLQIAQLRAQQDMLKAQYTVQSSMDKLTMSLDKAAITYKEVNKIELTAQEKGRKQQIEEQEKNPQIIKPERQMLDLALSNIDAQIANIVATNKSIIIKAEDEIAQKRLRVQQEINGVKAAELKTEKELFEYRIKELPYLSDALLKEQNRFEQAELTRKQKEETAALDEKARKIATVLTRPDANKRDRDEAIQATFELEQERQRVRDRQQQETIQVENKQANFQRENAKKRIGYELDFAKFMQDQENKRLDFINQEKLANEELYSSKLETAKKYALITEEQYVLEKSRLELEKEREKYSRSIQGLETSRTQELATLQQQQKSLLQTQGVQKSSELTDPGAIQFYNDLQSKINSLNSTYDAQKAAIDAANTSKLYGIELVKQEQLVVAKLADTWNKVVESLSALGETGKGIAEGLQGAAAAIAQFALKRETLDKDYASKSAEIEKDRQATISVINSEMYDDEAQRSRDILKVNETAAKKTTDLTKSKVKTEKALEMDRDIAVIGSAKKLFKEKTAAYRIFATLEKAMHIARLIMDAKEIASTVAKTAINIVESGKRAFAAGQEAIAAAFAAKPWPLGLVAGGAMIAIMAGLLGKAFGGGGGGAAAPSGFGMEEQRQTEGTGKSWVNGQLVDTGGGKPGGDGRASSLEKGLDLVAKYTFEGLNYSNGMLKALIQIEQNTRSAAYAVFRSTNPKDKSTFVGGIQTGELKPNTLRTGAANTLGAAAGAGLGFAAGVGLLSSSLGTALMTGASALIGVTVSSMLNFVLPGIGLLLAKPLGKLFTSIFGGKVTRSIEDSGIVIEGTLDAIVEGTQGVVQEYANLKTVKSGGWFRRSRTSFETVTQDAQADVKRYFAGIFSGMRDTLKEAGKLLGKDVSAFLDTYVVKDFKVSSQGRTAEEFADALRGEVSEAFNKMAQAAFPELEKFADAGEEFGETVIRMAKQISVFDTAMKMIGRGGLSSSNLRNILGSVSVTATTTRQVSTGTTTGTRQVTTDEEVTQQEYDEISGGTVLVSRFVRSISTIPEIIEQYATVTETSVRRLTDTEINDIVLNITDTLIDLAGGMEQFLERAQAIRENFLTDAQKVGQIAAEIRPILDSLGVGSIRSKADFLTILDDAQDNLVVAAANLKAAELTADTTDDAPAQQAFDFAAALVSTLMELAPGIAQVLDYETKLAAAREDQAMTIANLLGDEKLITAARDAQRARQLADMDVALRPGQQYIWALEDEKRIKDELIRLQDEQIKKLEQTKSTVSNLIKTLSDFKSQLLGGSQTILTPQQVYQQKKAEYDALVTAASSSDEAIRNAALAKLPQAASSFLDASRTMFASGTAYAADFNSVIQTLDAQGAELLSQEEYLAKQLSELQTASDQLKGINTNTQDTATRIAELEQALVTAQSATAIASAMWTSSSGEPIANFLTSTSNGANVVAAINNASANTATQNSQLAQATVGSIVQLGVDVDKSLEKWLKQYGWSNAATATYDNAGP